MVVFLSGCGSGCPQFDSAIVETRKISGQLAKPFEYTLGPSQVTALSRWLKGHRFGWRPETLDMPSRTWIRLVEDGQEMAILSVYSGSVNVNGFDLGISASDREALVKIINENPN